MPFPLPAPSPFEEAADAAADRARAFDRDHPERATLLLAAAGAAKVLGSQHGTTRAFAKAAETGDRVDMWRARLAMKTLTRDRREAIAAAVEN